MVQSLHLIEIDIFRVPTRPCRHYQERIAEYYLSGKPRFEWDKMRQKNLMEGDLAIERVCETCNLNLLGGAEGCKIRVEGLDSFLRMLAQIRPETTLTRYSFADDLLGRDDAEAVYDEFQVLSELLVGVTWPVAQIYDRGEPRPNSSGGMRRNEYFEYQGGDEETFIYSNSGYAVALARDGLVVRESLGAALPERFVRLWKDGASVFGETVGRRVLPFLPLEDQLPAWDDSGPFFPTELRFEELPALEIYGDIVETFLVYAPAAAHQNTGLKITQVG